ncbi:MAG TPA: DAK2 domain-containing protein [Symbiobacteriaceae bacterium]
MSNQTIDGKLLKQMILHAARTLEAQKDAVNALNVFPVPDGDTGTNMSMTMGSAVREVERARDRTAGEVAAAVAQGSLMGARGNSGVILSQLFRGFAKGCEGKATLDGPALARALQDGVDTAYKAVMKPVEGTILTVARESAAAAVQAARKQKDPLRVMQVTFEAAEVSLAHTPELLPVLKKAGVVDSGGKGLLCIFQGYYEALAGGVTAPEPQPQGAVAEPERKEKHDVSPAAHLAFKVDEEISSIKYPYDCEFFIRRYPGGTPIPMNEVAEKLDPMGDSIYVVGSGELAKVHIHSDNPGPVLTLCIQYGDLIDIVLHNMREQHADLLEHAERVEGAPDRPSFQYDPEPSAEVDPDSISVVAVAVGDGVEAIFKSLGVAHVIHGGQTMNPSTQDLLEAIEACPTRQVFVLPNNKNIILAAEQAAALTDKKVYVIPSRSIPQGIAAMVSFLPEGEGEKLTKAMTRSIQDVQTGEITFSVRDTVYGEISIKEGDILGLWNGQIKLTGKSPDAVLVDLLAQMVADRGGEVITVYWGEGVDEDRAEALGEELRRKFPDHEVEIQFGGQPLYFYVFSLE